MSVPLLACDSLTKRFGALVALDGVSLDVTPGEVHAVLGENGAGKSTLMNLLFGMLRPDAGEIRWRGRRERFDGPSDALRLGIGMVHQHFMLVPALTVWENVWLTHPERRRFGLDPAHAKREVRRLAERFGLGIDPETRVADLPVGARQRVEIAKALSRDASLLILDEPTAVLTPGETGELFRVVGRLVEAGTSVLFISHKLDEVLEISDRITVLRHGRVTARCLASEADATELARRVVGEAPAEPGDDGRDEASARLAAREPSRPGAPAETLLSARGLRTTPRAECPLRGVSFDLRAGEILGLTGVDGNGQETLVATLGGILRPSAGRVRLAGHDVTDATPGRRWGRGLSVLPGDRGRDGLALDLSIWENLALREFGAGWARWRGRWGVRPDVHRERAAHLMVRHDIRGPGPEAPASSLSGGNQQKLLLARELASGPRVIVLLNPGRGLDIGAVDGLWRVLRKLREEGCAVLLVSTDLDEVLANADRWAVMHDGRFLESQTSDRETIGAMMLGAETP